MSRVGAKTRARAGAAVVAIVALDQASKSLAVRNLADGPAYLIGHTVSFELARNSGSAFSRFQGFTPVLAVLACIVTVILIRTLQRASNVWLALGLVLVLGGALGNLADRIFRAPGFMRGAVVDFVKVGWFPVFNVADSAITLGAAVLIWRSLVNRDAA